MIGPAPLDGPALAAVSTTLPVEPGVIVGDDAVSETSALPAAVVTDEVVVLFPATGSGVALEIEAEPPASVDDGVAEDDTSTGIATVVFPLAARAASEQVTLPLPAVQPAGSDAVTIVTPAGGVYTTVGTALFDGPTLAAVIVTVPVVPGTIVGVDVVTERSALAVPTFTDEAMVLSAFDGSFVVEATEADPPVRVDDGVAPAGTDTGIATDVEAPLASGPATVQVTVPVEIVHPAGNEPDTTEEPVGAVYVNVIGPAASEGPEFVAVTDTAPEAPGVIVGVVMASARLAAVAFLTTLAEVVLLALFGSAVVVAAVAEPPVSVPAMADDGTATVSTTEVLAPEARFPATVQVTVPDAWVQPDGSGVTTDEPVGAV